MEIGGSAGAGDGEGRAGPRRLPATCWAHTPCLHVAAHTGGSRGQLQLIFSSILTVGKDSHLQITRVPCAQISTNQKPDLLNKKGEGNPISDSASKGHAGSG
jgi:hypothetical protein